MPSARPLFLPAALLLAACTQTPTPSTLPTPPAPPTPPAAHPRPAASFPLPDGVGLGQPLFISLTCLGKERLFILDTGAGLSVLHAQLAPHLTLLDQPATANAPFGQQVRFSTAAPPPLFAGPHQLQFTGTRVGLLDLTPFQQASARPIEGILGMDVLRAYVLRLDFRARRADLFTHDQLPPAPPGAPSFPLVSFQRMAAAHLPFLGTDARVLLDTGAIASVGAVSPDTLRRLDPARVERRQIPFLDAAGVAYRTEVRFRHPWTLDNTRFDDLALLEAPENMVGLPFLASFVTTFDFPRGRVTFESVRPLHPPPPRRLGFGFDFRDGRFFIVHPDPAVTALNIHQDDELLAANAAPVAGREPWHIAHALRTSPAPTLTLRRGDQTFTVSLPPSPATSTPTAPHIQP